MTHRTPVVRQSSVLGQSPVAGLLLVLLLTGCSFKKGEGQDLLENITNSTGTGAGLNSSTALVTFAATGGTASSDVPMAAGNGHDYRWLFYTMAIVAGIGWLAVIIVSITCFAYLKRIRPMSKRAGSPDSTQSGSLSVSRQTLDQMKQANETLQLTEEGDEHEQLLRQMSTDDMFIGKTLNNPLFTGGLNGERVPSDVGRLSSSRLVHGLPFTSDPDIDRPSEMEKSAPPQVPRAPRPGPLAVPPHLQGAIDFRQAEQGKPVPWQGQEQVKWSVPMFPLQASNKHQQILPSSALQDDLELDTKPVPALRYSQHARPPALPTANPEFVRTQMYEPESDDSIRKGYSTTSLDLGRVPVQPDSSWTSSIDSNRWSVYDTDKPAPAPRHAQHPRPPAPVLRLDNPYLAPVNLNAKSAARPRPRSAKADNQFMRADSAVEVCNSSEFAYVNLKNKTSTTPRESRVSSTRRYSEPNHGYQMSLSTDAAPTVINGQGPPDGYEFPVCIDTDPTNTQEAPAGYEYPMCTNEPLISGQQPIVSPRVEIPVRHLSRESPNRSSAVASAPKFVPRPQCAESE